MGRLCFLRLPALLRSRGGWRAASVEGYTTRTHSSHTLHSSSHSSYSCRTRSQLAQLAAPVQQSTPINVRTCQHKLQPDARCLSHPAPALLAHIASVLQPLARHPFQASSPSCGRADRVGERRMPIFSLAAPRASLLPTFRISRLNAFAQAHACNTADIK